MNEAKQNSFSANMSAWNFVAGWNQPDVCGTAMFPHLLFMPRNLLSGCRNKRDDWPIVP